MDLPISFALLAALAGGAWSTWRGGDGVYAESLSMLVLLLLVGRFVQFRSQRRAREQIELIAALLPGAARRRRRADGVVEEVPLEALARGDRVLVAAGDVAPADGVVVGEFAGCAEEGAAEFAGGAREEHAHGAWVDLQALTGESRPIEIAVGARCWAGARVLGRPIEIEVEAAGAESRMGRIRALVEEAAARRAPVVEFADAIAGWLLLAVVSLAVVTFGLWVRPDPAAALEHAVALLVITCPCALGLATPLAIVASLAKAARVGVLIKGGDVLERLSRPGIIVLDKTGTLTMGAMVVERVEGDASALVRAAELERRSAHPLGRAIVEWAERRGAAPAVAADVEESSGRGMRGVIDGRRIAVGRLDFVAGDRPDEAWRRHERGFALDGLTPVAVAIDGRVVAMAGIGDPLRPEAPRVVAALRARGWRVAILSGDDATIVAGVAARVDVEPALAFGSRTPEEKLAIIQAWRERRGGGRPVVMVGDGVNDVGAMAAADVGVALGSGVRASLEVGDVCLVRDGIAALPQLLDGVRRTRRVIRANFALSLGYNLTGAALAMAGLMNPLLAAIFMPISGLTVTSVALRATRFASHR